MERKSDSKSNLNESTLPLLEDEVNKEKIELADKAKSDSADKKTEDGAAADAVDAAKKKKEEEKELKRKLKLEEEEKKKQQKLEKQKKKDEEKELKKQQKAAAAAEKKASQEASKSNGTANASGSNAANSKSWASCQIMTVGVDLVARDPNAINENVNIDFEDVIGEPEGNHGIDAAYSISYQAFEVVKFWLYRILMIILSVPLAIIWGVVFALLSLVSVWLLTPAFRVLDILLYFVHRLWNALLRTFLDPIFLSVSLVHSSGVKPVNFTPTPTFSGKSVFRNSCKYNQLSTSETVASYTKTEDENQVTLHLESFEK